eukprot:6212515-Pleurochrysis_carterae.AAC.2
MASTSAPRARNSAARVDCARPSPENAISARHSPSVPPSAAGSAAGLPAALALNGVGTCAHRGRRSAAVHRAAGRLTGVAGTCAHGGRQSTAAPRVGGSPSGAVGTCAHGGRGRRRREWPRPESGAVLAPGWWLGRRRRPPWLCMRRPPSSRRARVREGPCRLWVRVGGGCRRSRRA